MNQISLANTGFELTVKRERKRAFLCEMDLVMSRTKFVGLIQSFASGGAGSTGWYPVFPVETLSRQVLQRPAMAGETPRCTLYKIATNGIRYEASSLSWMKVGGPEKFIGFRR